MMNNDSWMISIDSQWLTMKRINNWIMEYSGERNPGDPKSPIYSGFSHFFDGWTCCG